MCYLESQSSSRTINSKLFEKTVYIKVAVNQHNESNSTCWNSFHIWYTGVLFYYLAHLCFMIVLQHKIQPMDVKLQTAATSFARKQNAFQEINK